MKKGFTLIEGLVVIAIIGIVLSLVLAVVGRAYACGFWSDCAPDTNATATFTKEAAQTEINQRALITAQPIPKLEDSQERKNLIERLTRFNNTSKVSYIYLLSFGKVMAFYTVKGKVSSVNSLLTNPSQLVDATGVQCSQQYSYDASHCVQVPSPDIDGSYGSNGDAIFFFTTDNTYVEYRGDYMLADQPLQLTTTPELVRQVK